MVRLGLCAAIALIATQARAVEIDFAQNLLDIDNKPFRDCQKQDRSDPNNIKCDETSWVYHTLGLISYTALDAPVPCAQGKAPMECALEGARRAVLARKVYPGKEEKHLIDLNSSEVTLILEGVGRLNMRPLEALRIVEILDASRLK